ncbi:DNA-binding protein WhiA [Lactobacillus johnsonii]|uniref:Probable cell division protein WhiA n=2 Tax=Lactobacillus johnsonii TaxID=33959 RepID=D0R537_LACJF|nr:MULTISPECIES: DNA-binding protein WhiA [Lactobacillus]ARW74682.1 DNA-binding protein WhiA [Lactobacillus johnsonii]ARW77359.1 DNA-binding protein WhiA [Lactobacillus johnsonii]MBZ4026163.1 DNA-binding protein WhiA [Lactobacillus johnsonii]MBZ4028614.1 DNA-binding protein WhiA [Lactobacillus johnsonii]NME19687.1 DNA-binding protein WhiA [Lactobacillus johnsonii]
MVSYASDVKKELTSLPVHPEHAKAELAAFLRMNGVLSLHDHQFSLDITTENPAIARRIFSLIKTAYGIEPLLIVSKKMKLKKNYQYLVRLQKQVHEILTDLEIFDNNNGLITGIPEKIMSSEQRAMSYLRGAFLASGSVNNPETSRYHLEIYSLYEDHNQDLLKLMNNFFYLNAKETRRRSGYIVYLKEAEKIGDFLHIVGAVNAMLAFEDLRIMRDMRNSVNRLVNCDTANLKKTANAAAKQVEDIQLIEEKFGLENLPEKLTVLARFRLTHPELSLKEVAAQVPDGPISKSGVNHRFQKIREIAKQLKEEN